MIILFIQSKKKWYGTAITHGLRYIDNKIFYNLGDMIYLQKNTIKNY